MTKHGTVAEYVFTEETWEWYMAIAILEFIGILILLSLVNRWKRTAIKYHKHLNQLGDYGDKP